MDKLAMITKIYEVWEREHEDEEGDKYLSQSDYVMEAIDAVLHDIDDSPILRAFMEAEA